jgi:2-amino-4-hydroxy-6-hydroxymethyldihydropteridine diphosphokinase
VIRDSQILVALGANSRGVWGQPSETLERALVELKRLGIIVLNRSPVYETAPIGGGRQPSYLNAVIQIHSPFPPATLLRHFKALERLAGRRFGRHWGPRPLDLDIIDARWNVTGWRSVPEANKLTGKFETRIKDRSQKPRRVAGRLILPHPEIAHRAFVLIPLRDVSPHWYHRALHRSISQLIAQAHRKGMRTVGHPRPKVRYMLDFRDPT